MMIPTRILAALSAAALMATQALPASALGMKPAAPDAPLVAVQTNCYAVGQDVAASRGGELLKAEPETRGGQTVCVIVVLVPGKGGGHPRREEVVVPAG